MFDYSKLAHRVEHTEIRGPADMPARFHDRETLWSEVERRESRKDSQLAREFLLSTPHELTFDQRRDLVRGFVEAELVAKRMVADIALHRPEGDNDDRNFHAHVLVAQRQMFSNGFRAVKTREWNSRDQLAAWREAWMDHCNRALGRAGHDMRVDNRSLEAQLADAMAAGDATRLMALDRKPEPHIPKAAYKRPTAPGNRDFYQHKMAVVLENQRRVHELARHWRRRLAAEQDQRRRTGVQQRPFHQKPPSVPRRPPQVRPPRAKAAKPQTWLRLPPRLFGTRKRSAKIPREWIVKRLAKERPLMAFFAALYSDAALLAALRAARVLELQSRLKTATARKRGIGRQRRRAKHPTDC